MFVRGARANRPKVATFVIAGTCAILLAPIVAVPYAVATLILGSRVTRLPVWQWWRIPPAFAAHHLTYYCAILWGMLREIARR
jgi:hypothetical protein